MGPARRLTWSSVGLAAILVVAAWLRLRHLSVAEFSDDQAIALRIAHEILHGDVRTVGLASSSGAANPPLYVYLAAVVVAIHDSVVFASASVAVLSVAAVALTYFVVRPRFGALVALTTSALFTTAPWAVLYGRHFWQQDYLPLVMVGLLWSVFVVLERDRTRVAALVPVLFVIAFQLDMSAVTLVVPLVVVLAYRARDLNWRALIVGAVVGVLSLGTWLAHVAKHPHDLGLILTNGRGHHAGTVGGGAVEAVRMTVDIVSAGAWTSVTGAQHPGGAPWVLGRAAGIAVIVLLATGMATSIVRVVRARHRLDIDLKRRALLAGWLVCIWIAYLPSKRSGVAPFYLLVTYPASFLLAALGLKDAASLIGRRAAAMCVAVTVVIAAAFVAFTLSFQSFVEQHGGTAGDYGVAYNETAALAAAARARGLHVAYARAEYLITGHINVPDGLPASKVVQVRDRLRDQSALPCAGERRTFGPLEACFP